VLATELWIFLYYIQYQPLGAVLLLMIYVLGWILLETQGRQWLDSLNDCVHLYPFLTVDVPPNRTAFLAAVQRIYAVVAAVGLLAIPSILTLSCYGLEGVQHHSNQHAQVDMSSDNPMISNISTIRRLSNGCWEEMDIQEKLDTLQVIADIETNYLKIAPVSVVSVHLENDVLGAYNATKRTIKIDFDQHMEYDAMECLNTLLHECRHAFQHDCIESLDWSDEQVLTGLYYAQARQWRQNFAFYTQSSDDYDAYQRQAIEVDARKYADEVEDIYQQYCYLSNLPVR